MKGHNISSLKKDLQSVDWNSLLLEESGAELDVNSQFDWFHLLLLSKLDIHCPEKMFDLSPKKLLREPWLTKGLVCSYTKQRCLYKTHLISKSVETEQKYKKYRNTLQRVVRKEKIHYYNEQCIQFKSNSKRLWQIINELNKKVVDKGSLIESLKIDNLEKEDAKSICNEFGKYFSSVGRNYVAKISGSEQNISHYLRNINTNPQSVFLSPFTEIELEKLINKLPNKKSSRYDGVSNVILKEIKAEITKPLMRIFNNSLSTRIFPTSMKHAEVVPL